jgi:NADPH:quinone reductase-like Zn-dependent oxidoreductase
MRAALLAGYGDVDKLEIRDVPEPEPGPGEAKVRVAASSINPIDYWTRSGRLRDQFRLRGGRARRNAIANAMTPGPALQRVLDKVKPGGTIGSVTGEPAGAKERGLVVRAHVVHPDPGKLAELARAAADGSLVIPIAMRVPLAQIREAHSMAEKGAEGKVVLRMQ